MEALITASGKGTRLWPLTATVPKTLVKVLNKPILDYILDYLNKAGIEDRKITVTVGYRYEKIIEYSYLRPIKYIISHRLESMAHVVAAASHLMSGPFVLVEGDTIQPADAILDSYKVFKDLKLSVLFHCPTENKNLLNKIISLEEHQYLFKKERVEREKRGNEYIKYTAIFYDPKALQEVEEYVPQTDEKFKNTNLAELISQSGGAVRCLLTNHWSIGINTPEQLKDAENTLRQYI